VTRSPGRPLARLLFRLARRPAAGRLVRLGFAHGWRLLPVRRVASTPRVLAFHHPRPGWPTHLLLVPKLGVPGLLALDPARAPVLGELLALADEQSRRLAAAGHPVALVINGGAAQEVGQLHAHLIAGPTVPVHRCPPGEEASVPLATDDIEAFEHPTPDAPIHLVLRAPAGGPIDPADPARVAALAAAVQELVPRLDLEPAGFSLTAGGGADGLDGSCLHLVSRPSPPPPTTPHPSSTSGQATGSRRRADS